MADQFGYGDQPDEQCLRDGCGGFMEPKREGDCSCHIAPPCSACVDAPLVCTECDHKIERED